jgi:hypothetical protein
MEDKTGGDVFVVKNASFWERRITRGGRNYHDVNVRHMAHRSPIEPLRTPFRIFMGTLDIPSLLFRQLAQKLSSKRDSGAGKVRVISRANPLIDICLGVLESSRCAGGQGMDYLNGFVIYFRFSIPDLMAVHAQMSAVHCS